jgi:ATP-dependent RNA/DNA helicase IGHMBP2
MSDKKLLHFERLLELLHQERDEDLRLFLQTVRERPLAKRVEEGYTWYPLNVLQTGFALGEKAFVVVERTARPNEPHQLRAGQSVNLFTQAPDADQPEKQGVINYVERNRMKIILNARDVPDWLNQGQLGVDMLFDDRSYQEMVRALEKVMTAKGDRLAELRDLVRPRETPPPTPPPKGRGDERGSEHTLRLPSPSGEGSGVGLKRSGEGFHTQHPAMGLNPSQQSATHAILENRDIAVIHGPPGTGKTTTLVAAIQLLTERESTVLVAAPSNTAADLLTERLADKGLNVVRVGNISRVDEKVLGHTLEAILAKHPESKNIKKVKIEAAESRRQARRYKRSFHAEDRREREHLKQQARELDAWARTLEDRLVDQILTSAQAITCTLVGAAHPVLHKLKFRTCVIDEAAQALEPACWIPIAKCSRVVLAGDPFQLPPTVKSQDAARGGLSHTLIERCIDLLPDRVTLLTVQYRMHQAIMDFSNQYFYGGALEAHASVAGRGLHPTPIPSPKGEGGSLPASPDVSDLGSPMTSPVLELLPGLDQAPLSPGAGDGGGVVTFIDTAGCGFEERVHEGDGNANRSLSRFNPEETLLIREHLLQLLHQLNGEQDFNVSNEGNSPHEVQLPSVGILSPYREQVNYLEQVFREDPVFSPMLSTRNQKPSNQKPETIITINTIDGFQGQERDVIYLSLVRSNAKHEIGFLQDYRRMNVAMTRARMLLIVVGDSATIGNNKFYQSFLDYCSERGAYKTAWEYMR